MIGRVYLDSRPDLRSGADGHRNDVKNDAVEVEEHATRSGCCSRNRNGTAAGSRRRLPLQTTVREGVSVFPRPMPQAKRYNGPSTLSRRLDLPEFQDRRRGTVPPPAFFLLGAHAIDLAFRSKSAASTSCCCEANVFR